MFSYAKNALVNAISNSGSNPIAIGEIAQQYGIVGANGGVWNVHNGTIKATNEPVTVFIADININRNICFDSCVKNALKRARTIRHPDLIKFVEGYESSSHVYIATEPVIGLSTISSQDLNSNLIVWGLYKVASALNFLNSSQCNLIHGNVRRNSIFLTNAGEWKLFGFDVLSIASDNNSIFYQYALDLPGYSVYLPPEINHRNRNVISNPSSIDSWGFGCLINEVYNNGNPNPSLSQTKVPSILHSSISAFHDPSIESRSSIKDFLDKMSWPGNYFDCDFVHVNKSLEELSIKDNVEKQEFLNRVEQSIINFPIEFCKYKILPELIKAVEYGGADVRALAPILKLGLNLNDEEYSQLITPIVIKLYKLPDRVVRLALLETAVHYIDKIDKKTINDKLFNYFIIGFNDTSAVIRESSIKAVIIFVPKLNEKIINNDLLRHLARLQQDTEPAIRTNTTILLGKITENLNDSTKRKILIPAFTRALSDTFPPTRSAGISALLATIDCYNIQDIAMKLIPSISNLTLDPHLQIRQQALSGLTSYIAKLESNSNNMSDAGPLNQIKANNNQSNQDQQKQYQQQQQQQQRKSSNSDNGWAVWALSQVATKATDLISGEMGVDVGTAMTAMSTVSYVNNLASQMDSTINNNNNNFITTSVPLLTSSPSSTYDNNKNSNSNFSIPQPQSASYIPTNSNNNNVTSFKALQPVTSTLTPTHTPTLSNYTNNNGFINQGGPSTPSLQPMKISSTNISNKSSNNGWSFDNNNNSNNLPISNKNLKPKNKTDDDDPWETKFGGTIKTNSINVWDSEM